MNYNHLIYSGIFFVFCLSCSSDPASTVSLNKRDVKLVTIDPGHFHAALVQKKMYNQVDSIVHVYAPKGTGVQQHLKRIEQYNTQPNNPTNWYEKSYIGDDFMAKFLEEKPGNVAVLAGDNASKIKHISVLLDEGINVLADKPLIISPDNFSLLKDAFSVAKKNNLILYDIMTERFNIFSLLQNELIKSPKLFGELQKGTPEQPGITKESLHYISKKVSGENLIRPPSFFNTEQQGEGVTDISTHFVDLILWGILQQENISIKNTEVIDAIRWPTKIERSQFQSVTGLNEFPDYLQAKISNDSILNLYCNGNFTFRANGFYSKVSIIWKFKANEGGGDTYYSKVRGTKANIVIRQEKAQNYQPTLYIEPIDKGKKLVAEEVVKEALVPINKNYPGITYKLEGKGWKIVIPEKYKEDHETHFSYVMEKYLQYLNEGGLPDWEKELMLTKYYITTQALEISRKNSIEPIKL